MKHLRSFNESLKEELQDFCETYLAYLVDDGFRIYVSKFEGDDYHQIMIGKSSNSLWSEMKDQILPFLHFLFKDYELYYDNNAEPPMGIVYYFMGSIKQRPLTLEQINNLPDNTDIGTLYIRVVKKGEKVEKAWFRNF